MAARLGSGAGLLVVALGTAIIAASLTLGVAAAVLRDRADLTEHEITVVNVDAEESYVFHVFGPGGTDIAYTIFPLLPPDTFLPPDATPPDAPAGWKMTVPASATIDVYGSGCEFLGRVPGKWGSTQSTLTVKPAPKGLPGTVKGNRYDAQRDAIRCW